MPKSTPLHTTGLVFGVFDGLHEGHRYILTEAAKRCERLVVVVTVDAVVEILKKKFPRHPYEERVDAIRNFNADFIIVPSDPTLGGWHILDRERPDMIFLGYDQTIIAHELERLGHPHTMLDPYHPEILHSSMLNAY